MGTVLVVDDDPISRDFLRTLLGYRGHDTCEAADGDSALTLARQRPPDAVITDVRMPKLGGYELARMLRSQPGTSHIPIAFSTAYYGHDEIEPMARACGVRDVIFKPAQPTVVLATIDALLAGRVLAGPVEDGAAGRVRLPAPRGHTEHLTDRLTETHRLTRSGTWDLDRRNGLIMLSASLCDLLRLPSVPLPIEQLRQRVHPDDVARLTAMAGDTWRTGLPGRAEARVADMDGEVHELIVSCRPAAPGPPYPEGARTVWGAAQDVTEIRQAHRTRLQAQVTWHAERRTADAFHRAMMPRTLPTVAGADLGVIYLAAPERLDVGAGWYDALRLGDGRLLLSIGKVAGHDQPGAAAMAPILAVLRAYALDDPDPGRVLARLNRYLAGAPQGDAYVTAVVATYDPGTNRLCVANAGHPAPLLISPGRSGGAVAVRLSHRGPALGVLPDAEFTGGYLTMGPGWMLCAYTDGLTDRHSGPTRADSARLPHVAVHALGQAAAEHPDHEPAAQDLAERIVGDMLGGDPPDDDVCLAVLRTHGAVPD